MKIKKCNAIIAQRKVYDEYYRVTHINLSNSVIDLFLRTAFVVDQTHLYQAENKNTVISLHLNVEAEFLTELINCIEIVLIFVVSQSVGAWKADVTVATPATYHDQCGSANTSFRKGRQYERR